MAYTMAYTDMSRRDYGTGSVLQRCEARYDCPPLVDGKRPKHNCKGRWYGVVEAGFTKDGTRRRITVSAANKTVAKNRLRDKQLEMDAGGSSRRTMTVAKWATEWLETIETKVTPSALTTDKAAVKWIVKTIGHVKIADLTQRDIRSVAAAIRSAGKSSTTALRYHGPLIRMLKAAAADDLKVPPNVLLADTPTAAANDREALSFPQTLAAIKHLTRRDDHGALLLPDSSRWTLAFLQGIRQAEVLGLTWDEVDLEDESLTICWQVKGLTYRDRANPKAGFIVPDGYEARQIAGTKHLVRPKSKAGWRKMPLVEWGTAALVEWRELAPENPQGLVWPGSANKRGVWPRDPASDREEWYATQRELGIEHPAGREYKVHEIRHTTATLLMKLNVPESVRIAIMGHSKITTTRGYEHVDITQAREALKGVGRMLELG